MRRQLYIRCGIGIAQWQPMIGICTQGRPYDRLFVMSDRLSGVMPSATPTDEEIAAWNELSREEQLKRYRELFSHPDCNTVSGATMDDILAEARRRSALPRG
jgi:hypothetical protein